VSNEAELILRLEARTKKFQRDLSKAIDKLDGNVKRGNRSFDKGMSRMERRAKRFTRNLAGTFGGIGLGASLVIGSKIIADFRQSMSTVKAVTGATASEFALLEDKARALGATTRFSASQAADGMVALGRAGFSTQEVLSSIEGTLLLAQSGALELGSAADIASNVLQGFRLNASEAGRAVDVLSLAANSSNTDVEQLGQALSFVAPASASVGVSLEETSAAISALSDAGIQATRAGTGLRHILIQLASNGQDLSQKSGGLQGALRKLASQNIDLAKASELVGNRQAASLLVLLDSIDKIGDLDEAYQNSAGSALKTAKIMDDNLNGALLATKSRLQEMVIALGEAGGEQTLIDLLERLQATLTFVAENADTFNKTLIILAATASGLISGSALGGVWKVLGKSRTSFLTAATAANVTTVSVKGLTLGVKQLLIALGPAGWVALAAGAIAAFVQFGGAAETAAQKIDSFDKTMGDLSRTNKSLQEDTKTLEGLMHDLADASIEIGEAAQSAKLLEIGALNERIAKNKELAETYKTLLRAQLTSGQADVNKIERDQLALTNVRSRRTHGKNVHTRSADEERRLQQEGFNKLLEEANLAAEKGEILTKKQTDALELHVAQAEALAKVESARAQLRELNEPTPVVPPPPSPPPPPSGGGDGEAEIDKALKRQLDLIEELGKTEREQIADLLKTRLEAIEKSGKAEKDKASLRSKAHADAEKELKELRDAEVEAAAQREKDAESEAQSDFSYKQDRLSYIAEIAAAQARMSGRALEATQIELEAVRDRYQAELDYINEVIKKKGETPELLADRANAEAGIADADANIQSANESAVREFDSLASGGSDLDQELERIDEIEREKLERLEELRTEELEALRDFEAQKTQIEADADAARSEARIAALRSQLNVTQDLLGGITTALRNAGKENTKAAKIAAKAQQVISLANAVINTAEGVSEALAGGNIPKAILVGALGAIQVGIIASQTFDGGGYTGKGARVGGVDGKGGFYALLHPNETIVDHNRPNAPIGGKSLEEGLGISTPSAALSRTVSARALTAASRRSEGHSFRSGDLIIQGNVDSDMLPELKAQMDDFRKNQIKDFNEMADARERRTTPRTQRRVGRGSSR